jgi:hypothetical protein
MNVTERATPSARPADARSPFVRLAELLAGIEPGQTVINIAVGEPQHPIPSFVGPVLAAHLADFGRYPANAGTDRYRQAVAGWLDRRYALARPIDPASEILVLSGTREGLFLAAIAARRWVKPRGKPAMLIPNPFTRSTRRERSRPTASRSISMPPRRTASCPISMRSRPSCSHARRRFTWPRRPIRRARSPTLPICSA